MESIVINIKNENDKILLSALAGRLRLKSYIVSKDDQEDFGLLNAMNKSKKSGRASEKEVMEVLNKWK